MNIEFRKAVKKDIEGIIEIYDQAGSLWQVTQNCGWRKGIYPVDKDAENAFSDGSLFVGVFHGEVIATMILSTKQEEAYRKARWSIEEENKSLVIYTFAVKPGFWGQGVAEKMLSFACTYAKQQGALSLRLDVYEGNTPAICLYEKCGFKYVATISLGLEELGLDFFRLYEKRC